MQEIGYYLSKIVLGRPRLYVVYHDLPIRIHFVLARIKNAISVCGVVQ